MYASGAGGEAGRRWLGSVRPPLGEELLRGRSVQRRAGRWRRGWCLWALSGGPWPFVLMAERSAAEMEKVWCVEKERRLVQKLQRVEGSAEREDLWTGELIRGCCGGFSSVVAVKGRRR